MRLRLVELQEWDKEFRKIRVKSLRKGLKEWYKKVKGVLHHQRLPFVSKIIQIELISCYYNNSLAGHFDINKTKKPIIRKYYWPSLGKDVEAYVKDCDIYLGLKVVRHKPYGNL